METHLALVGYKGFKVLEKMLSNGNVAIDAVYLYQDDNLQDEYFGKILALCNKYKIEFFNEYTRKINETKQHEPKRIFLVGWQFLLDGLLDNYIVLHDSLLPENKGWSPTVSYLLQGSSYLAATAFSPTDEVDTGMIYNQKKREITYPMKIKDALDIVSSLYVELIEDIVINNLSSTTEMMGDESFSPWRDHKDYNINFNNTKDYICRFVDAVGHPYKGAKINIENHEIIVHECEALNINIKDPENNIGKIISIKDNKPVVVCKNGAVQLSDLRKADNNEPFEFKKLKIRL